MLINYIHTIDQSGITFYYTETAKKVKHPAVAHHITSNMLIPPQLDKYSIAGLCSGDCTRKVTVSYVHDKIKPLVIVFFIIVIWLVRLMFQLLILLSQKLINNNYCQIKSLLFRHQLSVTTLSFQPWMQCVGGTSPSSIDLNLNYYTDYQVS